MRDALTVRILQRIGHARADPGALQVRELDAGAQQILQRTARDPLDHQVSEFVAKARIENGQDVRVMQAPGRLGLAHECLLDVAARFGSQRRPGRHDLHRLDHQFPGHHPRRCADHVAALAGSYIGL